MANLTTEEEWWKKKHKEDCGSLAEQLHRRTAEVERLRCEQPRTWLAARIEHALTLMPLDAGAQWMVGWLLAQADMPQTRADQIMSRCGTARHPEQEPVIPLCERCRHKATMHTVDGEERRECMEWQCSCEQYDNPIDEVPR